MNSEVWMVVQEARRFAMEHPYESIASAFGIVVFASFSLSQRKWIRARDENKSQMRHYSEEQGWHTSPERPGDTIEVHHLEPQAKMFAEGKDPDTAANGISLWAREHTGKGARPGEFVLHPDMAQARLEYRKGDKEAFAKAAKEHQKKAKKGEVFWQTDHDIEMSQTARERTDNMIMSGKKFPQKKKR